jgi:hypothetical protein
MGDGRNVYTVLMGKHKKKPLEKPRRRLENGTKMDLREIGCEFGVCSPGSSQGSLLDICE